MTSSKLPTPEQLDKVALLCAAPDERRYFFDRLNNPRWVKPLDRRGFFEAPATEPVEGGYVKFRQWAEGEYLVRMTPQAPQEVESILKRIRQSENPDVTGVLFKCFATLPDDSARRLAAFTHSWILGAMPDHFSEAAVLAIRRLTMLDLTEEALQLTRQLLIEDPSSNGTDRTEAIAMTARPSDLRISEWRFGQILEELDPVFDSTSGLQFIELLVYLLRSSILLNHSVVDPFDEDFSYIWRPSIEDHAQNNDRSTTAILVSTLRDSARSYARAGDAQLVEVINFLELGWPVERRMALYLLAFAPAGHEMARERVLDRSLFDEFRLRNDYARLLKSRYGSLSTADQATVLGWIDEGPDIEDYRRWRTEREGTSPSDEEVGKFVDVFRRDWLSFLVADPAAKARFDLLAEVHGPSEHPDFPSWITSGSGPSSPLSVEELDGMDPDLVVRYLSTWLPGEATSQFFAPDPEGLSRTLSEAVARRPHEYARSAMQFAQLDPTYVRGLLTGLETAVRAGTAFGWEEPLGLAQTVADHPFEADYQTPETRGRDPGWRWCRRQISSLMNSALRAENCVPASLRPKVWGVLARLTEDPNPSAAHEAEYGGSNMDPLMLSLNTNRGSAMHAVISYALWCRGVMDAEGVDTASGFNYMPEVRLCLDERLVPTVESSVAVRAVYGQHLPWLVLLDEAWVASRVDMLFPNDDALRNATWDTYLEWCEPYDSAFRALRTQYLRAIEECPSYRHSGRHDRIDVDAKLGQHLTVFYWRGIVTLETLMHFLERADPESNAKVISSVGHALANTDGDVATEIADRLVTFWNVRSAVCEAEPWRYAAELRAFGSWFAAGKLDLDWAFASFERSTGLAGAPRHPKEAVDRLAGEATAAPLKAVRVLKAILVGLEKEWDYYMLRDSARTIVAAAVAVEPNSDDARSVVDFFVRRGELDFREELKPQP